MAAHKKTKGSGWVVRMTKEPSPESTIFQEGYFPRQYHYKNDAQLMVQSVRDQGGEATIEHYVPVKE